MKAIKITKETFTEKVFDYTTEKEWKFKGNKPAIIDFYADWCAPCKMIAPVLDQLAKEYSGQVDFYKIDTEKEQELSTVFGIRSIPSLLFIPKEGQPKMQAGAISKQDFIDTINSELL